eukprot:GFYU01001134.1.p1 GENE.GFYU01001134.1~~GFYU01001134.1.p1  ORF type:complete len:247 (-),score=37.26 GFYU01001134.1:70-810(-)
MHLSQEGKDSEAAHPHPHRSLVFLCGACGSGKTSVAELLRESHGFVHFDGDAWQNGFDPIKDANFSMTPEYAKRAAEKSPEMTKLGTDMVIAFMHLRAGKDFDQSAFDKFYSTMCSDVKKEWDSSNQSMVVTHCAYTRSTRDTIRKSLEKEGVKIVLLDASAETLADRLISRYVKAAAEKGQTQEEWLQETFKGSETMETLREKTLLQTASKPESVGTEESCTVVVDTGGNSDAVVNRVLSILSSS